MHTSPQTERQALDAAINRATRRKTKPLPRFSATADVQVFMPGENRDEYGISPAACLRVQFYVLHAFDSGARWAVDGALARLGVPEDKIKTAIIEYQIVSYVACNAIGVRRKNWSDPVEAFYLVEDKDRARLIRQRRLVPESIQDSLRIYRPDEFQPEQVMQ